MIETFESELGQSVKMTELYDYLGLEKSHYSRFIKKEIFNSLYFEKGKDYCLKMESNAIIGKRGQFRQEIYIHINTAKKVCMLLFKTQKKSKEIYVELMKIDKLEVIPDNRTRKELLFEININEILEGITKIIPQYSVLNYRIDFYLPELKIAIEYDEKHHSSKHKSDNERQKEIEKILKCDFIRVGEYCEQKAINKLLKMILHKSLQEYQYNDDLSVYGDKLLNSLNIKTYQEIENEKFIEILNKK